jgi:hypothetical protein
MTWGGSAATRHLLLLVLCGLGPSIATAQYSYNPNAVHEQVPGIRYFGSARDAGGAWLAGVTVVLASKTANFIFFTDEEGRFSGNLPEGSTPSLISVSCSKNGFQSAGATKRPDAAVPPKTVQVDCTLRASKDAR